MRFGWIGAVILIVGSLVLALKGLWILFKHKKYLMVLGHLLFLISYPLVAMALYGYRGDIDSNIIFWASILISILVPVWLMYGFIINGSAGNVENKSTRK